jgi:glycosyltransferase 2 family protein
MKSVLITGLRLIVTAAMLAWIFSQVDLRSLGAVMAQADLRWIILGIAVYSLSVVFSAWRWQRVLVGLGFVQRLPRMVRLVLSGAFFNMFLPSSVGGDVMKMVLIAPDVSRREVAISSVLMDRVIGLAVTIGVGLAAVLLLPQVWGEPAVLATLALAVIVFCVGMITIFNRGLIDLAGRIAPKLLWNRLGEPVLRVHESLMLIAQNPRVLLQTSAISVLRQLVICLSVYFASRAFGMSVSPIVFFATVPIAVAITALPVAINGLGLQDNALIFLLGAAGVTAVEALSLSIFLHALRNGIGLLGGIIFAFTRQAQAAEGVAPEIERATNASPIAD